MTTLLVTGGAGFIGSNFVRYSREHYPYVRLIVLDSLTYAGNVDNIADLLRTDEQSDGVEFVHGFINDELLVDSLIHRCDVVVHFAAESHNDRAIQQPDIFFDTNVMGTLTLLKAAQRYNVRFHHISTDEVYGDTPLDSTELFTENSPYRPSSPYAASKAASDHMVRAWIRTYGLRATISNCSNNFGPYQHIEKFIPRAITNALQGLPIKVYGDGLAVRDWIHVDDQCRAIWTILEKGELGETYLVGARCAVNNMFVVQTLVDIFESNSIAAIQSLSSVRIEHVRNRAGADRRYALNTEKIGAELGWTPVRTDFKDELCSLVQWYAEHKEWWIDKKDSVENNYALEGH